MRAPILLAAVLVLAGCSIGGGGGDGSIESSGLEQLVLQPEDLPRVFVRFDEGRQTLVEQPQSRPDPDRAGRQGGWKARYRRAGTADTAGPLVVVSLVDVFESADGAEEEFDELPADLQAAGVGWEPAETPALGDESFAMRLFQDTGVNEVAYFRIAWRTDNAVAAVEVNGFRGKVELDDAVALARKQARRISQSADE